MIAFLGHAGATRSAKGRQRIVVDLAARDDRDLIVEQIHEAAKDPALGLTPQAEKNEVVTREDRVDELRDHGLVVSDDAGKERVTGLKLSHKVVADFLLDRARHAA